MKIFYTPKVAVLVLGLCSCDAINDLIPDIDTDFTETFQIQIFTNSAESENQIVDVTSSAEFNDFKDKIGGFKLRKISYKVKNYNAPADMFFSGTVICSNEELTETYIIGAIDNANLSEQAESGHEIDLTIETENVEKVLSWLDSPGRFNLKTSYFLTKSDGTLYEINGDNAGSNFELEVKVYVTVKTQI